MLAESIAEALGGQRGGDGWTARCPAHDDRTPSLSIRAAHDGKVLVHCHAGCDQKCVIAALRAHGLWGENPRRFMLRTDRRTLVKHKPAHGDPECSEVPLAIWRSAKPASGTLVETYLALRGIEIPAPHTVRFHPGLKHPEGGSRSAFIGPGLRSTVPERPHSARRACRSVRSKAARFASRRPASC